MFRPVAFIAFLLLCVSVWIGFNQGLLLGVGFYFVSLAALLGIQYLFSMAVGLPKFNREWEQRFGDTNADEAIEAATFRQWRKERRRTGDSQAEFLDRLVQRSRTWVSSVPIGDGELRPFARFWIEDGTVHSQRLQEELPDGNPGKLLEQMVLEEAMIRLAESQGAEPTRDQMKGFGAAELEVEIIWDPPLN